MMSFTELHGSCLCTRVRFAVQAELDHFYFCHCAQCRKITGSAFAANILAKPAAVTWLSGSELVRRFDYPGERAFTKVFCSNCGSGLPFLNEHGTTLFIPAGSLDSLPPISPERNIFWEDRAVWYEEGVAAVHNEEFP
jgi:hypothetical protein